MKVILLLIVMAIAFIAFMVIQRSVVKKIIGYESEWKARQDKADPRVEQAYKNKIDNYREGNRYIQNAHLALQAFFALMLILNCFTTVETGSVAVKTFLGSVKSGYIAEGVHPKNPLYSTVELSIRTKTMETDASADIVNLSQDQLEVVVDVTQPYRLLPSAAAWVYQNVGDDFYNQILLPAARTSVRNAVSKFDAQQLVSTKRDEFALEVNRCMISAVDSIFAKCSTSILGKPRVVFDFPVALVRKMGLPNKLKDAIELKLSNQQEAEAMTFKLQKERQEAERKRIEAEGIQAFQSIVTQGITENLLRWKGIEATEKLAASMNAKFVIIGSGRDGLPVILNTEAPVTYQKEPETIQLRGH